ncbi:MAG TPA: hypothetical protein EYO33_10905 [Phycisphaerales bacterium]|nr:hypothetical protein [Phycisphaerales bacterium]
MSSTSVRSHSLSAENCAYLDRITKGHKSAAVNAALDHYRGAGLETAELLANIAGLQKKITELHQELDGENPVAQGWGKRLRLAIKRWFHI